MTTRLLIADDSDLLLLGIETLLQTHPTLEIVDHARCAEQLFDAIVRCDPHVIFFSERLDPTMDVLQVNAQLHRLAPHAVRLVLGSLSDGYLIRDLFRSGIQAYLYSGDSLRECLPIALKHALKHELYLSPTANSAYLVAMQSPQRDWTLDSDSRQVLRLLSQGLTIKQIAQDLQMSHRHIYWLRQKLRKRFGANTNEDLVVKAMAEGFARLPE